MLNIFDVVVANPRLAREYDQAEMKHQIKDSMIERYGLMTMITLGEIIAGLYEVFSSKITSNTIFRFIIIALIAAIYYQVLGTLHIIFSSSIATILTGWLFILVIMFSFYMGVTIQLVLKYENKGVGVVAAIMISFLTKFLIAGIKDCCSANILSASFAA